MADVEFAQKPDPALQTDCGICHLVLQNPCETTCCSIYFCRACLEQYHSFEKSCPFCRTDLAWQVSKRHERLIKQLKVVCKHKDRGCEWVGELGQLSSHLNEESSDTKTGCKFVSLECPRCHQHVQRGEFRSHSLDKCSRRDLKCPHQKEGCTWKGQPEALVQHLNSHLKTYGASHLKTHGDSHLKIYEACECPTLYCIDCNQFYERTKLKAQYQRCTQSSKQKKKKGRIPDMRGVDILDEKIVQITNASKRFCWEEYGLRLIIPQESLPENISSCTITISVSLSGHYHFLDDMELMSPVFWLKHNIPKNQTFLHPLSLEIEHCALPENSSCLFMARAASTQIDSTYNFEIVQRANFNKNSSYGVLALNSFSGVGVVQKGSKERRYWSNIYYMPGSAYERDIHLVVAWHQKAHIKNVKDYYVSLNATSGCLEQKLTFKEDRISLNLPKDGINVDGWKVIPGMQPIIFKEDVDNHRPNHVTVPNCVIKAIWPHTGSSKIPLPSLLYHTVDLLGTTQEMYFVIQINPDFYFPKKSVEEKVAIIYLTSENHAQITSYLADLNKDEIIDVGVKLGLKYTKLSDASNTRNDMVSAWLRKDDNVLKWSGPPSWNSLQDALEACGHTGIASKIAEAVITDRQTEQTSFLGKHTQKSHLFSLIGLGIVVYLALHSLYHFVFG